MANGNLNLSYFVPVLEKVWDRSNSNRVIPDPIVINQGLDEIEGLLVELEDDFGSTIFVSSSGDISIDYNEEKLKKYIMKEYNLIEDKSEE